MQAECPFCDLPPEREWLETEAALAVPDLYPAAEGHTLVLPKRHVERFFELDPGEQRAVWELVADVHVRLREAHRPDGFTIGINDGLAAGQTMAHAHVHVIPRHLGDVGDPTGGLRGILPHKARYWEK
jgi:diadenosine tetraphosphate (Ap4A) HIT family hydrolase